MSANRPDQQPDESPLDSNDPVWQLLGHAPLRQPDAWFTARTLTRCRHAVSSIEPAWIVFGRLWRWTISGGVGLSLGLALVAVQLHPQATKPAQQKNVQDAFAIVAALGPDSDSSNTAFSSWQDPSSF
jgi:hypothetical protein